MSRAVVVLSGGQDSTTCLAWAKKHFDEVAAVTFNYGQRHACEIYAAETVAALFGVFQHEVVNISDILKGSSPLVNKQSELEQYKDWGSLPGGLEKTFVPMRNLLFLTLAANRALAWGCNDIITGVCQEDFGGYPDCRQIFINATANAIARAASLEPDYQFNIHTPLMDLTKAESVNLAIELGAYGALGYSHTSYDGKYPPTGHDHATLLRAKGFEQAGVPDPLIVRAYWEGEMNLPQTENYHAHKTTIDHNKPWLVSTGFTGTHHIAECLRRVVA